MATLRTESGRDLPLGANHTIGRDPSNHLVVDDGNVSRQHAALRHASGRWVVKDLGSRNGTFVNGQRLAPGTQKVLVAGDVLAISSGHVYRLVDARPPEPMARALDNDTLCIGIEQVLGFPDPDEPLAQVVRAADGWSFEAAGEEGRAVRDGDRVSVEGRVWRLSLPEALAGTVSVRGSGPPSLRFEISLDEEHVRLFLVEDGVDELIGSRAHHYTLLVLARQRIADANAGLPRSEIGWINQQDLERMLRLERNVVYQHFYRARRELAEPVAGLEIDIIQRRHDAGQVRLGMDAEVGRAG